MSDVRRIRTLLSDASAALSADVRRALSAFEPEALVAVLRSGDPWWMRAAVVPALTSRLDAERARVLLERAEDPSEVEEVRCVCVDALADARRVEAAPALLGLSASLERDPQRTWRLPEALVSAAGRLGATKAAPALVTLRCDPWSHKRARGEEGLRGLIAHVGLDGVVRALGGTDASDGGLWALALTHPDAPTRRWAVDAASAESSWLVDALRDGESIVADGALERLASSPAESESDAALDALTLDAKAPIGARARAMLALWRRGHKELAARRWRETPDARVSLPDVPDDVRRTVLAYYLPGERGTDPRWVLEGVIELGLDRGIEREQGLDETPDAIVDAARHALLSAGLTAGEAVPIGSVRQQGDGTYREMKVDGATLSVCELGRFVMSDEAISTRAREALTSAGFRVIEGRLASAVFNGLRVYFFGGRDPLPVADLLFYWQD